MFDEDGSRLAQSLLASPTTIFLMQTSAPIFEAPSSNSAVLIRVHGGDRLTIQAVPEQTGWWTVTTANGQDGFMVSTTKVATRDDIVALREKTKAESNAGVVKIFSGLGLLLIGVVITALSLYLSGGRAVLTTVLIAAGAGSFLWGIEQIFFARHALKKFDEQWNDVLKY